MGQLATESQELCADFLNNLPINTWGELLKLSWNPEFMNKYKKLSESFRQLIDDIYPIHQWIWRRLENIFAETWTIITWSHYLENIKSIVIETINRNIHTILNLLNCWTNIVIDKLCWIVPNHENPININQDELLKPIFDEFWPQDATSAMCSN